jgi:hypothetical protein
VDVEPHKTIGESSGFVPQIVVTSPPVSPTQKSQDAQIENTELEFVLESEEAAQGSVNKSSKKKPDDKREARRKEKAAKKYIKLLSLFLH